MFLVCSRKHPDDRLCNDPRFGRPRYPQGHRVRYDVAMSDPQDIVLLELQGLRRELAAVLEQQETFMRHMIRLADGQVDLSRQMMELTAALSEIRSDVLLLKSQNLTRHNEVLDILRRLDEIDHEQREPERQRRQLRDQWVREDREAQEEGQRDWVRTRSQVDDAK